MQSFREVFVLSHAGFFINIHVHHAMYMYAYVYMYMYQGTRAEAESWKCVHVLCAELQPIVNL